MPSLTGIEWYWSKFLPGDQYVTRFYFDQRVYLLFQWRSIRLSKSFIQRRLWRSLRNKQENIILRTS